VNGGWGGSNMAGSFVFVSDVRYVRANSGLTQGYLGLSVWANENLGELCCKYGTYVVYLYLQ
jgi:hypothetical protein